MGSRNARQQRGAMPCAAARDPSRAGSRSTARGVVWAEDFLFAGTSALLLALSGLWPELRLLSLVSLTPFLYRVWWAAPLHALRVGLFFGCAYFLASLLGFQHSATLLMVVRYAAAIGALGAFGWVMAVARRFWGLNPVFVAAFWVAVDWFIVQLGITGGILGTISLNSAHLSGLVMIWGFLSVAFVVILFNAILVLAWCVLTRRCNGASRRTLRAPRRHHAINWDTPSLPWLAIALTRGRAPPCSWA